MPTLTYVRLLVDDFPECFRFYRDVMGFHPTYGDEGENYADFEAGGVVLALFQRAMMAEAIGRPVAERAHGVGATVLVFEVEDVDAELSRLKERGAVMVADATDRLEWGLRTAHVVDPAGNILEMYTTIPSESTNVG